MAVLVDDPLISSMAIRRPLPLHDSSRRLRELYPESPRVYGVAVMSDVGRRRWWPLASAVTDCRLSAVFTTTVAEIGNPAIAAQQLAATLAHAVVGRVVALVVLEGRAWDAGLENLWFHVDSEGAIDWAGVSDPTLRVLPDDPRDDGAVRLPSDEALATWTAHRFGSAVIAAATHVPILATSSEVVGMRRGQAVLDALAGFGLPVRCRRWKVSMN